MTTDIERYVEQGFGTWSDLIQLQGEVRPDHVALVHHERIASYSQLNNLADRVAASLQRDGFKPGDTIAICALSSIEYVATFVGALRTGVAVSPLAPSSTPDSLAVMIADSGARLFFCDAGMAAHVDGVKDKIDATFVRLDSENDDGFYAWLAAADAKPEPVEIDPSSAFNIIYSSGTTGAPKGIVQPHKMRWLHCTPTNPPGYGPDAVAMLSTPLYSNTTLVSIIPCLAGGGTAVLLEKFKVETFLDLAQKWKATHAMLVPVQYKRLMDYEGFDDYDLSSFKMKFCTSAPFSADLKAEVLKRWPGGLTEFFGMTEGGGSCALLCHEFPDKLHTVGQPMKGHVMRIIDDDGNLLPAGKVGEIVGKSRTMMNGYHNQPGKTSDAQWVSPEGDLYIRTGDIGQFDEDGFLTIMDRKKDMIISGGFNIYPSDIEAEIIQHPDVADVSVIGAKSDAWGETPVAFITREKSAKASADEIMAWVNGRVGKTQRLAAIREIDELPRSAIGKVLKRELRDVFEASGQAV